MSFRLNIFWLLCLGLSIKEGLTQTTDCKENEEFHECGTGCPLTCQNFREPLFCTQNCRRGCFCKPGFVLGPNNICVTPENCPIGPCRDNETPSRCVNPCNNCLQRGRCFYEFCNKGCDCRPGFYRNSTGHCVIASTCEAPESVCPKNERYVHCVNPCNDCWSRGECEESYCQPGCDCNPGYLRDEYGSCVPESLCNFHGCSENEIFSECVNPCNDCERKGNCQYSCNYGCDCKRGFYRNHNGICIPAVQCPSSSSCGLNEIYTDCGSACPVTCDNFGQSITCTLQCVKGCFCIAGYVRSRDGRCVRPDECHSAICGIYEEYSECGTSCPIHCTNITTPSTSVCPNICVRGCFCKGGYVRAPNNVCVPSIDCPVVCGEHEVFQESGSQSEVSCTNVTSVSSYCSGSCKRGCVCAPGYVRGPNGLCILPNQCPIICHENEEFKECGSSCVSTCDNRVGTGVCPLACVRGCFCRPGYIKGRDGKCILPEQCPPVCGRNEEFLECGSACPPDCNNRTRACREFCVHGCFCKPGFIRDLDGRCVLPEDCHLICSQNEIFMTCGPRCEPSCDALHRSSALCPSCERGCFCKPGFVRGPDGKCISPNSCPPVCGENEEFSECGSSCPPTCSETNRTCPTLCVRSCFCKPGFVRDQDGKCVLLSECRLNCGENEEFSLCGSACPPSCVNRTSACPSDCIRGCFCTPDYVRDDDGKCILPLDCPQDCPENESFRRCGSSCPISCDSLGTSVPCRQECTRGCFCNDGFVRGPNGVCVRPEICPPGIDGRNKGDPEDSDKETTVEKSLPTTVEKSLPTTSEKSLDPTTKPAEPSSTPGTTPVEEKAPTSVQPTETTLPQEPPSSQADSETISETTSTVVNNRTEATTEKPNDAVTTTPQISVTQGNPTTSEECSENESFHSCGFACPISCSNLGRSVSCRQECKRGCFCNDGFVRGPNGTCVRPETCPLKCGRHEILKQCGTACQPTCANRTSHEACIDPCVKGCFCKRGYIRNHIGGRCILTRHCHSRGGGHHKGVSGEGDISSPTSTEKNLNTKTKLADQVITPDTTVAEEKANSAQLDDMAISQTVLVTDKKIEAISETTNIEVKISTEIADEKLNDAVTTASQIQVSGRNPVVLEPGKLDNQTSFQDMPTVPPTKRFEGRNKGGLEGSDKDPLPTTIEENFKPTTKLTEPVSTRSATSVQEKASISAETELLQPLSTSNTKTVAIPVTTSKIISNPSEATTEKPNFAETMTTQISITQRIPTSDKELDQTTTQITTDNLRDMPTVSSTKSD